LCFNPYSLSEKPPRFSRRSDHFHALWQPSGRPLLSLFKAMRSAGLWPPDMMGTTGQIAALAEWEADWNGFDDDASRRCFLSVMLY